jgi:glutamyl-tRNA reductase
MQRLLMIGMNHSTAPLPLRERCAFSPEQREKALVQFKEQFPDAETVLVSTCNRMEIYTARPVHSNPRREQLIEFICKFHDITESDLRPHLYDMANRQVADHLFHVAASLDSLVVGETQILGQVRDSYEVARKCGTAGALLHPLFQRAIATAREVMTKTRLGEGRRSIASIAVDYARQIFESFTDKTVLSIGAGKMSTLVLQHLQDLQVQQLIICNRDIRKADALAEKFRGTPVSMDDLAGHLAKADIVVSSTASVQPIITRQMFEGVMKQRRWRPVFLIDIALPRDVEEQVGDLDNVYLYNIDDLQQVAAATDSARADAVEQARQIVTAQVDEFVTWNRQREIGPLIERLFTRSHAIARDEVARMTNKLPDLNDAQKQQVEELARRIVNKLLHDPIQAARGADPVNGSSMYIHALAKLFRLDDEERG